MSIRFVVGRRPRVPYEELQSVVFDARQWAKRDVMGWLQQHGFNPRDLVTSQGKYRYPVRDKSAFVPRSLRAISVKQWEQVTMKSNPKRKKKSRAAKSGKKRSAPKRAKVSRTTVKTVKVMRTNPKKKRAPMKKRARALKRNARSAASRRPQASQFTIALSPAAASTFAKVARISKGLRREMLRSLRRHPSGGVYVAQAAWHGTRDQAKRLADRVQLVLAYAAGRRRSALTSSSVPRVVAVP